MIPTSYAAERGAVVAAVVLSCALFTSAAADPVNVIKLSAVVLCALTLALCYAYRAIRHRQVRVPTGPAAWAATGLLGALLAATAVAPVTGTAIVGANGRNSGLVAYVSALVLFVAAMSVLERPHTRVLVAGVAAAGAFTAIYGLLQRLGLDPVPWNNPFNPIIAAMGNPNFASGYLGVAASVAAGGALWTGWTIAWRAACAATALLSLVVAALSDSVQGPVAAAAGLVVVAAAVVLGLPRRRRVIAAAALGGSVLAGILALLLGALSQAGPFAAMFASAGFKARVHYWDAAVEMFRQHPWGGVGLDQYGFFWRTSRSPESVELLGGTDFSDAAHSVPLQFLAQGGLLLGAAYIALVLVVGTSLVRGLIRLEGADRMLLASVGGGWFAYQVQSAVSIDQVPLIVLHFSLAGAVLAASHRSSFREIRLPGARPVAAQPRGKPKPVRGPGRSLPPPPRTVTPADAACLLLIGLIVMIAAWKSFYPLRASIALSDGNRSLATGDGNAALAHYARAAGLAPNSALPWEKQGILFTQVDQPARAMTAWLSALDRDPYSVSALRNAASLAEAEGDIARGRALYRRLVEVDPLGPESIVAATTFALRHSDARWAKEVLTVTVKELPEAADLWATLGDARLVLGEVEPARTAYHRALDLQPQQPTALAGLEKLNPAT